MADLSFAGLRQSTNFHVGRPATFIITNFLLSYIFSSTRGVKRLYRLDHNTSPRQDVARYGEQMVKDGKITRRQLDRLVRMENAHMNSVEHFPFFFGTVLYMVLAQLPGEYINSIGLMYTATRFAYVVSYYYVETEAFSWARTIFYWASNLICIAGIRKSAAAML